MEADKENLVQELAELNMDAVLAATDALLAGDVPSEEIYALLHQGMDRVNDRCSAGQYFIADLIMAGNIFREAVSRITSYRTARRTGPAGRVLMGTVQGDIHELGKNLIAILLQNSGFEVSDLGVDVSAERFCDGVRRYLPDVLVLSGSLSGSELRMAETIYALQQAGLRSAVRVILGGSCIDERMAQHIGADAYSGDLTDCLRLCREFTREER